MSLNQRKQMILNDSMLLGSKSCVNNKVLERMQTNRTKQCFISLKESKWNFQNNRSIGLTNPVENDLGKISKVILVNINKNVSENLQPNEWKNRRTVIDWFITVQDKHLHSFVIFDIKDFYPSAKEKLLIKVLKIVELHTNIFDDDDKRIINHLRKSLLFSNQQAWKISKGELFDVTMRAYQGAEKCELCW